MVIDTSAILAILLGEPEAERFAVAIEGAERRLISTATALESAIVVEARKGSAGGRELDLLLEAAIVDVVPFSREQWQVARRAWRRYGKGRHEAALNLGDWFAYALATVSREPLLFKGNDFVRTDVSSALPS